MEPEPPYLVKRQEQQCCLRPQTQVYVWKVVMGFRAGFLLVVVLLFSCGDLCSATQNWVNISNNETLNQISKQQTTTTTTTTTSVQMSRSPQTTEQQTEPRHPVHSPVTYQLRSFQLMNPALSKKKPIQPLVEQLETFENLQGSEGRELTPDQLKSRETVPSQDLNSTIVQKSKVL